MIRHLRVLALAVACVYAAPVLAQSFEGLDLSDTSKTSKSKKKKRGKRTKSSSSTSTTSTTAPVKPTPPTTSAGSPAAADTGLGLDLSTSQKAGSKGKLDLPMPPPPPGSAGKGQNAPTMSFEGVDVSGKGADRQRLDAAVQQFKDKQYEQASLASWELMNDPKMSGLALESQYLLAKSLYRMGMYHSSLEEFSRILSKGPETKFFKPSLEWLFFISHKTTNESVILEEIAKYSNFEFPEKFRSEFRYLLSRYHFVRGRALDQVEQKGEADKSFNEVKRIALTFPRSDPFYVKAKYLEGLAHFRENALPSALESMKEVIRLTRPGGGQSAADAKGNEALRELAFMQLGRTHYGARQNRFAIYYFGKIERGTGQWLEALFEGAWANYRIGQYEQSLGNLITLSSPFFRDEYFPEALILKAVIYYENCRYRESTSILGEFERIYQPVHDELDLLLKKDMEASEYYNVLSEIQKKNTGTLSANSKELILERVLKLALTDTDLKNTNDSILELEAELEGFNKRSDTFKYADVSKHLIEGLKLQRVALVRKAGVLAKGKLQLELAELRKLLGNGERIKFETVGKEKEFLEAQLALGRNAEIVKKYKFSVAVQDDQLYWPYEGEYWRDELGTYQYTLTKGCIERDTANRSVSGSGSP